MKFTKKQVELIGTQIRTAREGILEQCCSERSPFDQGQLICTIYIAKDIARNLPVSLQKFFLGVCGIPNATL